MTTATAMTERISRRPNRFPYVIEEVDCYDESVCFTLRREVLWSIAHLFQAAKAYLPDEDVSSLVEFGDLIENAARAIHGFIKSSSIKGVETIIDTQKISEFEYPDEGIYLTTVDLNQMFIRLTLIDDEILLAGKLLQGIFEYRNDGRRHNKPEPRVWFPLRSLGNKLIIISRIVSRELDPRDYLKIADNIFDADGEQIAA